MAELIWDFAAVRRRYTREQAEARAAEAAKALTRQNREGRQALGCEKREYTAIGSRLYAKPMKKPNSTDRQ